MRTDGTRLQPVHDGPVGLDPTRLLWLLICACASWTGAQDMGSRRRRAAGAGPQDGGSCTASSDVPERRCAAAVHSATPAAGLPKGAIWSSRLPISGPIELVIRVSIVDCCFIVDDLHGFCGVLAARTSPWTWTWASMSRSSWLSARNWAMRWCASSSRRRRDSCWPCCSVPGPSFGAHCVVAFRVGPAVLRKLQDPRAGAFRPPPGWGAPPAQRLSMSRSSFGRREAATAGVSPGLAAAPVVDVG